MTIKVIVGNVGSGKTLFCVRQIAKNPNQNKKIFTNIAMNLPNVERLTPDLIFKKEVVKVKNDGTPVYDVHLNKEFFTEQKGSISIILDEAHTIASSRNSMSKQNKMFNEFISLCRKILGQTTDEQGDLIFITQRINALDVHIRQLCHNIIKCRMHYIKTCDGCSRRYRENSDHPEPMAYCPICKGKLVKGSFLLEVLKFAGIEDFHSYEINGIESFYARSFIRDLTPYMSLYDTMQLDDLFS